MIYYEFQVNMFSKEKNFTINFKSKKGGNFSKNELSPLFVHFTFAKWTYILSSKYNNV